MTLDARRYLVPKLASDADTFRRRAFLFDNGRSAIRAFAAAMHAGTNDTVLCPAYVGWSPQEGSGVLDPLTSLGLRVHYYRVGEDLQPDLDDVGAQFAASAPVGVLLIHFFGHVSTKSAEVVRLAKEAGAWVLEDCAHAMLTQLVGEGAGDLGDASVFSLHKLLPISGGGALLMRSGPASVSGLGADDVPPSLLWEFDLAAIARRRRANTSILQGLLEPLAGQADPLWPVLNAGDVMQTFPVMLRTANRDRVYERMNARGFGVVSLYHTLVEGIDPAAHPASHAVSGSILNLPVHQDLGEPQLVELVESLAEAIAAEPARA
ncbi:MAG: DegT/DnrJ/EryC1/StrS family aminotransferase [Candidatus Dormibacteria bacterium]